MLKTSEQARRLGTCYSKSGPRRPQRLSSKCPGDTNCDSQIAERPGFESTTDNANNDATSNAKCAAGGSQPKRDKTRSHVRYPRAARWAPSWDRSRLYRNQILQVNMRLKALAEIYTMHSFSQLCNLIFFVKNLPKFLQKIRQN